MVSVKLVEDKREVVKIGSYLISLRNFKQLNNVISSAAFTVTWLMRNVGKMDASKFEDQAHDLVPWHRLHQSMGWYSCVNGKPGPLPSIESSPLDLGLGSRICRIRQGPRC